jgi:hypothetical protein
MPSDPVDLMGALVALLLLVTSNEIAHAVGPFAAIIVAASAGAAISISGHEQEMRALRAMWYVSVRVLVAITLSSFVAWGIQKFTGWDARHMLVPVAFGLGWIRDYDDLRKRVFALAVRSLPKRTDGK